MLSAETRIANAALAAALAILEVLARRGLVGPKDIDAVAAGVAEVLESAADGVGSVPNALAAGYAANLDPDFAPMRRLAEAAGGRD